MHRNEMVHKCTLRKFHLPHITLFRPYLLAFLLSLGVTVSNSFVRFAYALVLPAMRGELGWNYVQSGWLNTANAIGYLIGAILTRLVIRHTSNQRLFIVGVLLTALAVSGTGLSRDIFWLGFWRMLSGITGAAAFIGGGALSANVVPNQPKLLAAGTLLPLLHPGSVSLFAAAVLFGTSMWNIPSSVTNLA